LPDDVARLSKSVSGMRRGKIFSHAQVDSESRPTCCPTMSTDMSLNITRLAAQSLIQELHDDTAIDSS
ncbi:MAG: hypothetical protein ACKOU6_03905, partial [Planctomycetota bacterium]